MIHLELDDYGVDLWEVKARLPEKPDAYAIEPRREFLGRQAPEPLQFTIERVVRQDVPALRRMVARGKR